MPFTVNDDDDFWSDPATLGEIDNVMRQTEEFAQRKWAVDRVTSRPEFWSGVAQHIDGFVAAWRLMSVCRAAREGMKTWLGQLPGLVVCGGETSGGEITSEVWKLDQVDLRWERMPSLSRGRTRPACCSVRGGVVVLGGQVVGRKGTTSVEILGCDENRKSNLLPPLSCSPIYGFDAVAIQEDESEQGQVMLIGGYIPDVGPPSLAVHKADLATGVCTPQPHLLSHHGQTFHVCTAARLGDGRIVCVGESSGSFTQAMAQVMEPPPPSELGSAGDANWRWRYLPDTCVGHFGGQGCVLSDGRFAVFGGEDDGDRITSCEVLTLDGNIERWDPLPPMPEARTCFACAAIGGCVIVAGGYGCSSLSVDVYEEALERWRRLPWILPHYIGATSGVYSMGSATM